MLAVRFPLAFQDDDSVEMTDEPGDYDRRPVRRHDDDDDRDRELDRTDFASYAERRGL